MRTAGVGGVRAVPKNYTVIKQLGAEKAIHCKNESVYEALKGQEFDGIFDTVGDLGPSLLAAAKDGGCWTR